MVIATVGEYIVGARDSFGDVVQAPGSEGGVVSALIDEAAVVKARGTEGSTTLCCRGGTHRWPENVKQNVERRVLYSNMYRILCPKCPEQVVRRPVPLVSAANDNLPTRGKGRNTYALHGKQHDVNVGPLLSKGVYS